MQPVDVTVGTQQGGRPVRFVVGAQQVVDLCSPLVVTVGAQQGVDPCSPLVVTVGAQQGVRPVQPVGCHCWSAARCSTRAARRLSLLERSKVVTCAAR
mgnify:CR=1 FL=1